MHKVKWYEPIIHMAILYIGIILGRTLSPDDRSNFHTAVEEYAVMVIGGFLFFFYVYKLYSWIQKIRKKSRRKKHKDEVSLLK
ncbi:hypothetical protein [Bacillus sp. UNC41MFS5]|uniref:hypothetical protein n=1 Tax=Bacillus sp. UNC41MFS5 TaxID=1449046 RepID=UPI001E2EE3D2|nr:hypothetical protein [Bacillus sp. UNC41MFS5]